MTELGSLWLPILLSSLAVFFASSVIHMAPLWHRTDYPAVPDQDRVMEALRPFDLRPGDYMLPRARGREEMQSPDFMEKMRRGPVAIVTVIPAGPWNMGTQLLQWFLYTLAVSVFAAYVAGRALPPGADYLQVFRFAGTTAFLAHTVALWQMSIWYKRAWSLTAKATLDGLIYALLIAGVFGALWPG
jgi:hypothetical protein